MGFNSRGGLTYELRPTFSKKRQKTEKFDGNQKHLNYFIYKRIIKN